MLCTIHRYRCGGDAVQYVRVGLGVRHLVNQGCLVNIKIAVSADLLEVLYADGINNLVHITLCI